ncbi:hypothetical protein FB451DRAFT_1569282 [Mycena latifolia]|nr:hypothetical protein FB451DRAFT_1569282 [Mycena latifolia]
MEALRDSALVLDATVSPRIRLREPTVRWSSSPHQLLVLDSRFSLLAPFPGAFLLSIGRAPTRTRTEHKLQNQTSRPNSSQPHPTTAIVKFTSTLKFQRARSKSSTGRYASSRARRFSSGFFSLLSPRPSLALDPQVLTPRQTKQNSTFASLHPPTLQRPDMPRSCLELASNFLKRVLVRAPELRRGTESSRIRVGFLRSGVRLRLDSDSDSDSASPRQSRLRSIPSHSGSDSPPSRLPIISSKGRARAASRRP